MLQNLYYCAAAKSDLHNTMATCCSLSQVEELAKQGEEGLDGAEWVDASANLSCTM